MDRRELEASWQITRRHLAAAKAELPRSEGRALDRSLLIYREYVDHNELELAMHALEHASESDRAPAAFWRALERAAANMGLTEAVEFYGLRADEAGS
ncbi:MAG: MafI family immunity protein [Gaiellales bacterium]